MEKSHRMTDLISEAVDHSVRDSAYRHYSAGFSNVMPAIINAQQNYSCSMETLDFVEFRSLRLLPADDEKEIAWKDEPDGLLDRAGSMRKFADRPISRSQLARLISSVFRNRTGKSTGSPHGRRYASAGGLYVVDTFAVILKDSPCGIDKGDIYHVVADEKRIEFLGAAIGNLDEVFSGNLKEANASAVLLHCLNLDKCIFKYGYRGVRYGLIEVGGLCHQVELAAPVHNIDMYTNGGFADLALMRCLDLSRTFWLPTITQVLGCAATPNTI